MRILVADDDPVSRRLMQGILERNGYEVVLASDGLRACALLTNADAPRLALIDWMMPELDGPAVCREVRRHRSDSYVYIALLTARQSSCDIVEGLEAGADDYLIKPCHPAELKARLLTGRRILSYEDKLIASREDMHYRATHDSLTDLANRASILSELKQAMETSVRRQSDFSVLLCDIDHFKETNDRYGHLVGDHVLEEVARRLRQSIRKTDTVGRYGGEEFLIVLDGCGPEHIGACAEQVRCAINGEKIHSGQYGMEVSVSIGAVTFSGQSTDPTAPTSVEQLLHAADEALYKAKTHGRDRVSIWAPSRAYDTPASALNSAN